MAAALPPFHLAFPVRDLASTRAFWIEVMGCGEGRSADRWVDLDLYGHQLTAHVIAGQDHDRGPPDQGSNPVDGKQVPIPHFGVILPMASWQELADRLTAAGTCFIIEPHIRFAGQVGEQATMFFRDPSGNAIEIKGLADFSRLFSA